MSHLVIDEYRVTVNGVDVTDHLESVTFHHADGTEFLVWTEASARLAQILLALTQIAAPTDGART